MRRALLHPAVLVAFPVVSLYVHNGDQVLVSEVIRSAVIVLIVAVCLWAVSFLLSRRFELSSIVVSAFFLLFFGHVHIVSAVAYSFRYVSGSDVLFRSNVVSPIWFLMWVVGLTLALRSLGRNQRMLQFITRLLNAMSIALALVVLVNLASVQILQPSGREYLEAVLGEDARTDQAGNRETATHNQPDVYYIVLDGYARSDILHDLYDVDNSGFLTYLQEKGFYVAAESSANYAQTALSLASSLNSIYLNELADMLGSESGNRRPLRLLIGESRAARTLEDLGYTFLTFSSGYLVTEIYGADEYWCPPSNINGFENALISTTPIPLILELPFLKTQYDLHRERLSYIFDHLADAARMEAPVFVVAHVIAPHPPFVFGTAGEPILPVGRTSVSGAFSLADGNEFASIGGQRQYQEGYRDQLLFVSDRLRTAIDEIFAESDEPPIIILQADHGPGSMLDWNQPDNSYLPERMSILNAYYFPDQNYKALYPEISPVNSFRVIMNQFFGARHELLPDRSYYSPINAPYRFLDVTKPDDDGSSAFSPDG